MMERSGTGYRRTARVLHWLVAIVVIATLPVGMLMLEESVPRETRDALFIFHKNVGVVILLLVLARLAYRAWRPPPPMPDHLPRWQVRIAGATHAGLYVLLLVMAVSGYVRVEAGNFPIELLDALGVPALVPVNETLETTAQAIHFWTRFLLVPLIVLHVGAALHHRFVLRDGVFARMWPPLGR
ncbi:cytochrome b [Histidinibacterium lentulum]